MASVILNNENYTVKTSGLFRTVFSLIIRRPDLSNWVVWEKHAGRKYRLTFEEQEFLAYLSERLAKYELAQDTGEKILPGDRKTRGTTVLELGLNAIRNKRTGDPSLYDAVASSSFISKLFLEN